MTRAGAPASGWGATARVLHWGMAAMILSQVALGIWSAELAADLVRRFELTQVHKSLGAAIFALALVRLAWRLGHPAPPPLGGPGWEARAARANHALLYTLTLALPLTGWVAVSASPTQDALGIENRAFGIALPDPWVPGSAPIEAAALTAHAGLALLLGVALALHVGAALKRHFLDRDRTLARMIVGR